MFASPAVLVDYLGGIIKHASALTAITNPTVNSYKRINAPPTVSGATWAPNTVTWTGNNRTHMVRVPGPGRFELRLADGAANPYLLQAAVIAAGLDGLKTKADPGPRRDIDMCKDGHLVKDAPRLPLNLLDALRAYEVDGVIQEAFGPEFTAAYLKLKHAEWEFFCAQFTPWDIRQRSTSSSAHHRSLACLQQRCLEAVCGLFNRHDEQNESGRSG